MDYDTLRGIAERFLFETFGDVRSVRVTHIETGYIGNTWSYMVTAITGKGISHARVLPAGLPVKVFIAKDGEVVGLHVRGRPVRSLRTSVPR